MDISQQFQPLSKLPYSLALLLSNLMANGSAASAAKQAQEQCGAGAAKQAGANVSASAGMGVSAGAVNELRGW